jgi:hypothetical protein
MPVPVQPREIACNQGRDGPSKTCWRMMSDSARVIDWGCVEEIAVVGGAALDHVAALARQMPAVRFVEVNALRNGDCVRCLWLTDGSDEAKIASLAAPGRGSHERPWDVIVVHHAAGQAIALVVAMDGYARIAARRHHDGSAISVFGKGLARPVFRETSRIAPRVQLVHTQSRTFTSDI